MDSSLIARRGIEVEIETIQSAEFDLVLHSLGDTYLERVAQQLIQLPLSRDDAIEEPARIRSVEDHDVCFIVSRVEGLVVVTIMRIWPISQRDRMRELLRQVDMLAMLRGAAGI